MGDTSFQWVQRYCSIETNEIRFIARILPIFPNNQLQRLTIDTFLKPNFRGNSGGRWRSSGFGEIFWRNTIWITGGDRHP